VILVGQPQLNETLDYPGMDQLRQRVKLRYHIRSLNEEEVGAYIRHRLGVAGVKDRVLFHPEALPFIYKYTGGIPRLINTLCDVALTCAYADGLPDVTLEVMEAAIKELQWPSYAERVKKRRIKKPSIPAENGMLDILREQSAALAAIAGQAEKIVHLAPALDSIGGSLAAIEAHLRDFAQKQIVDLKPQSTVDLRKRAR
jgi:hypothetical protein